MVYRLAWDEALTLCSQHADKLVNTTWPEASCPLCATLAVGVYQFQDAHVLAFLEAAWRRQRRGRYAFSRAYWLNRIPFYGMRGRYDALLGLLDQLGVTLDRRGRASGKMVVTPARAMYHVRLYTTNGAGLTG